MKTLHVNVPNQPYDIIIGKGIRNRGAEYVKSVSAPSRILLVTDENAGQLYAENVQCSLKQIAEVKTVILPAGETTKSLEYLRRLYDAAFDASGAGGQLCGRENSY